MTGGKGMQAIIRNGKRFLIVYSEANRDYSVEECLGSNSWAPRYYADTIEECIDWVNNL